MIWLELASYVLVGVLCWVGGYALANSQWRRLIREADARLHTGPDPADDARS